MGRLEDKLDYLEDERRKIWQKIVALEAEVKIRPSDYENEAKNASRKASEFRNRCEDSRNVAFKLQDEINAKLVEINETHAEISKLREEIVSRYNDVAEKQNHIINSYNEVQRAKESVEEAVNTLEEHVENVPTYNDHSQQLEALFSKNSDFINKTESLYKSLVGRKKEFDQLYQEVFGFTEENEETGEVTEVTGLKAELENSFNNAMIDVDTLKSKIQQTKDAVTAQYETFTNGKQNEMNGIIEGWKKEHNSIHTKIQQLLPNALTAGLSYAYSEKKEAEVKEAAKLTTIFNVSIGLMVAASLIPFGFSAYWISTGREMSAVLVDMPRLVIAILPLYVPILWMGYSASKKINLSKRLIEEYTHKEVLSKTFEGLSRQINETDDTNMSGDLRTRLLYNILEVSSENPGKLITDYNKSDHPLMDALDKSVKLADAVEKLHNIPGFSKLTRTLDQKSKRLVEDKEKKVNEGLELLAYDAEDEEPADSSAVTAKN